MHETGNDSVAARLSRLERENRLMKRLFGAFMVFGVVAVLAAANQAGGDFIRTRKLILEDNEGNNRVILDGGRAGGGYSTLKLLDENRHETLLLQSAPQIIGWKVGDDGNASVRFHSE
jgi:hypothetical protein